MINFQSHLSIKQHFNFLSHSSKPISILSRISTSTHNLISFIQIQPFNTSTIQKHPKPKTSSKLYSNSERRIKEPFLSILLPNQEPTNPSQFKRNHQSHLNSKSMNLIQTHQSNQIIQKPLDSIHPISQVLNKYQTSSQISTTSQLVSEALQSVLDQSNQSSNLESCQHISSDQDWCLVYLKYLQSSKNPIEFSKRLGDLIINRLPRYRADQIIRLHSRHTTLRHLVSTDSYNQLIKFHYVSNRYDQVRSILEEMKERGLNLNLKTFELILYSYQALNKSRGVKLTSEKIQKLGLSITLDTWVTLFSIRPRQLSRVRHLDSMQDDHQSISSIDQFLKGWKWQASKLHSNGKAIITLSKKLMQDGKWKEAYQFIDTALTLNYLHDTTDSTTTTTTHLNNQKLSSFWAREFLHTLLYGLYNSKQQHKKMIKFKAMKSNESLKSKKSSNSSNFQIPLPSDQSIFQFVEDFIDRYRDYYTIRINSSILLNCLRIETCNSPSKLKSIIQKWNRYYGLENHQLGSKTSIRILHIVSSWFTKSIQHQTIPNQELIKQYQIIKEWWESELEQMMKRGPIDGKPKKGLFVFWTCQRIKSIKISLKKINQIRKKLNLTENENELKFNLNFQCSINESTTLLKTQPLQSSQLEIQDQVLYRWWSEKPNLKEIKVKI
ncbi:hypothetical protein DFH28DRAFT_962626 [Melampsora americana]|nr:hypothetical protein DFH28DRAFT_962626 [Melampsora americana]